MKQLTLTKPHLFILAGIPGAGKTFLANHFAKSFNTPLISSDEIASILFEKQDYSEKEQAVIRNITLFNLEQLLKTKSNIIYDGYSSTRVSRLNLVKSATDQGYNPVFIWVQTDLATSSARALKNGMPKDRFDKMVRKFTPLISTEPYMVVSGKHSSVNQVRNITNKLKNS